MLQGYRIQLQAASQFSSPLILLHIVKGPHSTYLPLMMVSLYTYNRYFFYLDLPLSQQCLQISRIEGFLFVFVYFFFVLFCLFFLNLIKTLSITKYLLTILTYKQCMLLTLLSELYSTYKTILIYKVRYLRY